MYSNEPGLGSKYKFVPGKPPGAFRGKAAMLSYQAKMKKLAATKPKVIAKPIVGYKPPIYRPRPNIAPVDPGYNIGPQMDTGGSVSTPAISPVTGGGPTTSGGGGGGTTTPVEVGTLDSNGQIPGTSKLSPVALLALAGAAFFLLKGK